MQAGKEMRGAGSRSWRAKVFALVVAAVTVMLVMMARPDDVRGQGPASYTLPFSSNPYAPSNAKAAFTGFLNPEAVPSAKYCAQCHSEAHKQWRESAHSNSFREPFYTKNVELLIGEKGIEYTRHCEGCHNPIALFTGALAKGSKVRRPFDEEGVTCVVCHSMKAVQNTMGTGSYVMGVPSAMVDEQGNAIPGEVPYDEILQHPERHKKAVMPEFLGKPEFCAVCHKAAVPKQLNGYKWLRAFSVYDEWQQSSWSKESPLPYYKKDTVSVCQTCHMPRVAAPQGEYGAKNGTIASHRWVAANTAIPTFYGYTDQLKLTQDFLKDDKLGIDIFALEKTGEGQKSLIAPIDKREFSLLPGETVIANVVIQNKGIGHSLVPEQRDFYECWVNFTVTDGHGDTVYESGFLKPDGALEETAHSYTNRLIGKDGSLLDLHQVWATRIKAFDETILPGQSDLVRFRFHIAEGTVGPLTLTAKVQYRRFRKAFSDYVLQQDTHYPIVEMASKQATLQLGMNRPPARESAAADLKRWNNYGIGLINQQQFGRARSAFENVLRLDPKYTDGLINVAVADLSENQYEAAQDYLGRALGQDPNNARAAAYRGIVYRLQYKIDRAIPALEAVTKQWPRMRQARIELGYAYFLDKKYESARKEYEAAQAVDPDDLMSHRYLAPIYKKLGMYAASEQQGAAYRDKLLEPSYTWVQQNFWRSHPATAYEVVPFHVHGEDPQIKSLAVKDLLHPAALWPDKGSAQ